MASGETNFSALSEKATPDSSDVLMIEDTTATKKITFSNLSSAILNQLTSKTFSGLQTSVKNLISAINEVRTTANTAKTTADTASARTIPAGGNTGQILSKNSNTDYDAKWMTAPYLTAVPAANASTFGGIKAKAKTTETVEAAIGTDGKLYVPTYPSGGGSSDATIPRQEMQNTNTAVTLQPNILYIFPEMASLTVTLAEPSNTNIANEWHWFFDCGENACVFSLQNQDGSQVYTDTYSIDANMRYEVSVLNSVAYIKGVAITDNGE